MDKRTTGNWVADGSYDDVVYVWNPFDREEDVTEEEEVEILEDGDDE